MSILPFDSWIFRFLVCGGKDEQRRKRRMIFREGSIRMINWSIDHLQEVILSCHPEWFSHSVCVNFFITFATKVLFITFCDQMRQLLIWKWREREDMARKWGNVESKPPSISSFSLSIFFAIYFVLRYESSTLILYKELTSPIFQSCQSVRKASVIPVQISTLCDI